MKKKPDRVKKVTFIDASLEKAFNDLEKGKYEDQQLSKFLKRAIQDLKDNPLRGIKIPSNLWPKEYIKKYRIDNLRKYDLPDGWRLIYTIRGNELEIISVLIEWFDHKNYEKRFRY